MDSFTSRIMFLLRARLTITGCTSSFLKDPTGYVVRFFFRTSFKQTFFYSSCGGNRPKLIRIWRDMTGICLVWFSYRSFRKKLSFVWHFKSNLFKIAPCSDHVMKFSKLCVSHFKIFDFLCFFPQNIKF
jgi:hypothetical protein